MSPFLWPFFLDSNEQPFHPSSYTWASLLPSPPHPPTPILTRDQFQALLDTLRGQQSVTREMDPLTLARLEHFLCQGLSSKFDGSPEKLPTWLLKFKDLREQHPW
jgi:hypothetical protein